MKTTLALAVFSCCALLSGQTLMTEPLGDTKEPVMTLFLTTLPPGHESPVHQHGGVVFIYVLEGEIESQLQTGPAKTYRAGEYFHERPNETHRVFRNVSKSAPARFLNFSNIATPNNGKQQNTGGVSARILLQEKLSDLANQEIAMVKIPTVAGGASAGPHRHPGPIFAYLAKGEVESDVEPLGPKVYRAGDVFFEPPMAVHRSYKNLSATEAAELIVFHVRPKGAALAVREQ